MLLDAFLLNFFLLYDRQSSLNMITERYLKAQNFNTKLNYV